MSNDLLKADVAERIRLLDQENDYLNKNIGHSQEYVDREQGHIDEWLQRVEKNLALQESYQKLYNDLIGVSNEV